MDKTFQHYINAKQYRKEYDAMTARHLSMLDVYGGDNADILKSYYLAYTKDRRRIIDANKTDKYMNTIAEEIAKRAIKSVDKVVKDTLK